MHMQLTKCFRIQFALKQEMSLNNNKGHKTQLERKTKAKTNMEKD